MPPSITSNRLDSLQIGRCLAAIAVVLLHVNAKLSYPLYFGDTVPMVFEWGKAGVDYFFILSGFIISLTLRREHTAGDFLWHRAVRIYPAFWLAFFPALAVSLLSVRYVNSPVTTDVTQIALGALLIPQNIGPPAIGVAWSLHHELLFYAVALTWTWHRGVALAIGCALLGGTAMSTWGYPYDFFFSPLHWEFVFGILAANVYRQIPLQAARVLFWVSLTAIVLGIAFSGTGEADLPRMCVYVLPFAVLIASAARLESAPGFVMPGALRHLARLGDSSYTLYLWHIALSTPIVKVVYMLRPQGSLTYAAVCGIATVAMCVALSHAIYLWVEKPLTRAALRLRAGAVKPIRMTP